jgi:hypothetical protein
MSIVPEILLQRAIIDGFGAIRKNPKIINALFKNLPLTQQEAIKDYILTSTIDFSINYPKSDIKAPAIVMLLKTESESNEFLGDIMGAPPNYDMPDQDMELDVLGGTGASTSGPQGLPEKVAGPLNVAAMVPGRYAITFAEDSQEIINEVFSVKSNWSPMNLHVVSGAGQGKVYSISSITSSRLDIVGTFELDLDSTSVVDIRYTETPEASYGNPVSVYEQSLGQLRVGANYDSQYQLEILAGNQEEVIYLYTVLKAILFAQRKFFEAQGIMALKISGSDLAPRSELLPDEIFTRSMTLQFVYPFSFIIEQDVAREIQLVLKNVNPVTATPYPGGEVIVARIEL